MSQDRVRTQARAQRQRGQRQSRRQTIDQLMGRDKPLTEEEIHRAMRPRGARFWVFGALALLAADLVLGVPLFGLAALIVLAIGILPELWGYLSLRGIRFQRILGTSTVQIGEPVTVTYQVENRKAFPVPWLEIEDEYSDTLDYRGAVSFNSHKADRQLFIAALSMWTFQRVTRRYTVTPTARGVYPFGPSYVRAGDPFGFLDHEQRMATNANQGTLTVLPFTLPLERFGLPSRRPFGDLQAPRPTFEDPSQVVGTRDFQPQDSLRRVHWKATARSGTLQSKVFPPTMNHTVMIWLDINTTASVAQGIETALMELGITAAASVAAWATQHDLAVGLCTNSVPGSLAANFRTLDDMVTSMRVPPGSHPDQLVRILRILAQAQPYFGLSMAGLVGREARRLPLGATVIYVSAAAALPPDVVYQLDRLRRHGHVVALLLAGNTPVDTGALLTYRLGGAERWHEFTSNRRPADQDLRQYGFALG